jgi:hypothetical protein
MENKNLLFHVSKSRSVSGWLDTSFMENNKKEPDGQKQINIKNELKM